MPGQEYYQSQFTGQQIDQKLNSIPTKVSDLTNDSGFIANTVNNLVNYYLKSDTYSKSEVDSIINTIKNGRFQNVNSLPEENIDTNVIYLVQKQNTESNNIKDEYINLDGTSTGWEKIGSTEINLDGYVTIQALNTALSNYIQTSNIVTILSNRTSFSSIENMVATPAADLYDGCLVYVTATKKNYQYDSTNETDPTLGKWREFSSGGGGGSSYTAGDGIDITEDVISTKKSQEGDIDKIVDVYPQAGNLVSIVNAFNKGDIYSTQEKMIGQWTNGKPLYQKTINIGNIPSATGTTIAHNISDIDTVTSVTGMGVKTVSGVTTTIAIPYYRDSSNFIGVQADNTYVQFYTQGYSSYTGIITLQYTKTTDTAISIGEATEYSTDEKIIGTWIDGKPVYQKTVQATITGRNTWCDTGFSTANKQIRNLIGIDTLPHGVLQPPFGGSIMHENGIVQVYNAMSLEIQNDELMIWYDRMNASSPTYPFTYTFTIQYTKTTT